MEKLGPLGFDLFPTLVVDLLHEFELGVWKMIFTQLIRLLYAASPVGSAVTTLNARCVVYKASTMQYLLTSSLAQDFVKSLPLVEVQSVDFMGTLQK
jgi:hypothetical protein